MEAPPVGVTARSAFRSISERRRKDNFRGLPRLLLAGAGVVLAGIVLRQSHSSSSSSASAPPTAWAPLSVGRFGVVGPRASGADVAVHANTRCGPGGREAGRRGLVEHFARVELRKSGGRSSRIRVRSAERSADGRYAVQWHGADDLLAEQAPRESQVQVDPQALKDAGKFFQSVRRVIAVGALSGRITESPPPPPPRPPRERKMTEVEKQADAIVHAVVAVELLQYHGKLGGTLETAFRKCVYEPALPRLKRLTDRVLSADDFKIENGIKRSRPSRVHDAQLEKQFTLGDVFTTQALLALDRGDEALWFTKAQWRGRQEFMYAGTEPDEDPAAKDLTSWSQAHATCPDGKVVEVMGRSVGHNDATQNIWILPVFVDHDRSNHAERQAMLVFLEQLPIDKKSEGVNEPITGQMRVHATHTPCISCLSSMMQLTRAFPGCKLKVTFDIWKETKRWIGFKGPREIKDDDE